MHEVLAKYIRLSADQTNNLGDEVFEDAGKTKKRIGTFTVLHIEGRMTTVQ